MSTTVGTHVVAYRVGRDQLIVRLQRGVMTGIDKPGLPDARDLPEDYRGGAAEVAPGGSNAMDVVNCLACVSTVSVPCLPRQYRP